MAMEPVCAGTWEQIPGYESEGEDASDSEGEEETRIKHVAKERLRDVTALLGSEWTALPRMEFTPVSAGSADTPMHNLPALGYREPPSQWGNCGPPPKFRIERIRAPLVRQTLEQTGLTPTNGPDWMLQWSGPGMKDSSYVRLHEYQKVNHFPGSTELTRKDRLWAHFHQMERKFGRKTFDFVPETYVLPGQVDAFMECYTNSDHIWIVKPHASSQGKGIFLLRNLDDLPLSDISVVSRYVDNPLLIQGLKFDLRIYVLVTSYEPLRAYVYREGLVRFASQPYSVKEEHLSDNYRHLTNYSINKKANNFVENQRLRADNVGHKWSLSALNNHLRTLGVDVDLMWNRIMDAMVKTLMSVEPTIASKTKEASPNVSNCFELYGFDVLVDDRLKPWLLEVNLSPCMMADSPLDWQVKSSLLADTFNLVGIHRADMQAVAAARMRQKLVHVRHQMGLLDHHSNRPTLSNMGAPVGGGVQQGSEDATSATSAAGVLRLLTRDQLKAMAHALDEVGHKSQNFIRLYPTRQTVQRYDALLGRPIKGRFHAGGWSSARLLAGLLFGTPAGEHGLQANFGACEEPAPASNDEREESEAHRGERRARRDEKGEAEAEAEAEAAPPGQPDCHEEESLGGVDESDSAAPPATPIRHDPEAAERAMRLLLRFGGRGGSRLLFMEYIIRIANACNKLKPRERTAITKGLTAERLKSFRQQLAIHLRMRAVSTSGLYLGTARSPLGLSDASDMVEQLADTCDITLTCMQRDAWGPRGMAELERIPPKPGEDSLARHCPQAFYSSDNGSAALAGLARLTAVDLEYLLRHHQCTAEFSSLLEPCIDTEQEAAGWMDGSFFHGSTVHLTNADIQKRIEDCWGVPRGPLSSILLSSGHRPPADARPRAPREMPREAAKIPMRIEEPPRLMAEDSQPQLERPQWPLPQGLEFKKYAQRSRSTPALPSVAGALVQARGPLKGYASGIWPRKPRPDRLPSLPCRKGASPLASRLNMNMEL